MTRSFGVPLAVKCRPDDTVKRNDPHSTLLAIDFLPAAARRLFYKC